MFVISPCVHPQILWQSYDELKSSSVDATKQQHKSDDDEDMSSACSSSWWWCFGVALLRGDDDDHRRRDEDTGDAWQTVNNCFPAAVFLPCLIASLPETRCVVDAARKFFLRFTKLQLARLHFLCASIATMCIASRMCALRIRNCVSVSEYLGIWVSTSVTVSVSVRVLRAMRYICA